jgi:hypothetical protein
MTIPTTTPGEALRRAFDEVDRASQIVEEQRKAQAEAKKQADAASALQTATQLELKNAEAKYDSFLGSSELAAPDIKAMEDTYAKGKRELDLTVEELQQAEAAAKNAERSRLALGELTGAQRDWLAMATDVALILSRSADRCEDLPAGGTSKASLRNIARDLRNHYTEFQDRLAALEQVLQQMRTAAESLTPAIATPVYLDGLEKKRERLEQELAEIRDALTARRRSVDDHRLQEAEAERDAARHAAAEASKAVQSAQDEVQKAGDSLAESQQSQLVAQQARDSVEAEFVTGIKVSQPEADGFATAQALIGHPIPSAFVLRWQAGGAPVEPAIGETVRIDARTLPVGDTVVTATLQRRQPKALPGKK